MPRRSFLRFRLTSVLMMAALLLAVTSISSAHAATSVDSFDISMWEHDDTGSLSRAPRARAPTPARSELPAMHYPGASFAPSLDSVVPRATAGLDDLSRAASALDRNNLTKAGRALQKHGDRAGSAFPRVTGSAADRNAAAQALVDDILANPQAPFTNRTHTVFGDVLEVRAPDGRGLRFGSDGSFIGLLEP